METSTLGVALVMTSDSVTPQLKGLGGTLADNKMAIRELSMGTMMLGASFMAMGVALKGTNSALGQTIGQTMMMVGSVMTAIGSTVQFISAISKTVDALQRLATSEVIVQALANPLLPLLGLAAAAIAVGGIKAMSSYSKNETKVEHTTTINLDGKQIAPVVRQQLIINGQQNAGTSGVK
jgi:hypothetical protein